MRKLSLAALVLAVLVTACLLWLRPDLTQHQKRAWTHDNSHHYTMTQDHIHPWMNNAWYRYVYDSIPIKDCYVCSHMPPTTQHATLYGKAMNMTQVKCAASYASLGYQYPGIVINHSEPLEIGLRKGTCDELFWVDLKVKRRSKAGSFPVFLGNPGKWDHTRCYRQSRGTIDMGNTTNCVGTVTHAPGAPVKNNDTSNGTYWVQGMAWLCGQRAYFTLPKNWTGTCAPIFISDHTFKITTDNQSYARRKRSTSLSAPTAHDPIWGSDVPQEFKLWTTGQKVLHSLFPWVGTGKNVLRWLLSGSWTVLLYKGLIFIGLLLVLFCVFSTCILPCLRKMISKMISTSLTAYVTVPMDDKNDLSNSEDNFEDEDVYV